MNRKDRYTNLEKWKETCRNQKTRYRNKTKGLSRNNHTWTDHEIKLVMGHTMTDRELSAIINRSISAIQTKRYMINKTSKIKGVA